MALAKLQLLNVHVDEYKEFCSYEDDAIALDKCIG